MTKTDFAKLRKICDSIRAMDDFAKKYAEAFNAARDAASLAANGKDKLRIAIRGADNDTSSGDIQQMAENLKKEKRLIEGAYEDLEKALKKTKAFKDFVSSL